MDGFDFGSSDSSSPQQFNFDSQPLQSFDIGSNFSTDPNDFVSGGSPQASNDYLSSLSSENQFSTNSPLSTDPNDFINTNSPSTFSADPNDFLGSASYPPSNFSENYVPNQNFSVDPSDFIPPSENSTPSTSVDIFSYPPSIETPLDNFVAEPQPINDTFFTESPKTPEENKPVSVYSSLSENNESSLRFVEKNQILRDYEFEHEKFLQERANEERKKHEEVLQNAQNEVKKFYAERDERTKKLKDENHEKSSALTHEPPVDDKHAWLNLDNLLDWRSVSKDTKEDTSRLRSILITLKH